MLCNPFYLEWSDNEHVFREIGREITVGNFSFLDDGNDDENDTSATLGLTSGSDEKINCGLILVSDR